MNTEFYETLRDYYLILNSIERRAKFWETFCYQIKQELKVIIGNTDGHLSYYENEENKSFGAEIKIIPFSDIVEVDGVRIYAEKKRPMLVIRQDHQGLALFEFISSHFNRLDGHREIKFLREPISPNDFDYQEMPVIVMNFIRSHIEWEKAFISSRLMKK